MRKYSLLDNIPNPVIQHSPRLGTLKIIIHPDEKVLVYAKDIAKTLKYKSTQDLLQIIDPDDIYYQKSINDKLINQSGINTAILASKKSGLSKMKRWVINQILSEMREAGIVVTNEFENKVYKNPIYGIKLLNCLKIEHKENMLSKTANMTGVQDS